MILPGQTGALRTKGGRGLGIRKPHVPPHLTHASFRAHPIAAQAGGTYITPIDFRQKGWTAARRKDQGETSACGAHSGSTALVTRATATGLVFPFAGPPSEKGLYDDAREVDVARSTPLGSPLPDLADNGTQTEDVETGMTTVGIRPRRQPTTADGRNSDCELSTINDREKLSDDEKSALCLVQLKVYAIDPMASDVDQQLQLALAAGHPVRIDSFVDTTFEEWSSDAACPAPDERDPNGGGHATVLQGFRINPTTGLSEYLDENSWGDDWCQSGFIWLSKAFIRASWALRVYDFTLLAIEPAKEAA